MIWRMAQLDLARQPETPAVIGNFIDLLAGAGYHALLFYLEDRICTASCRSEPEESYTPAEISELVEYARTRSIELIPCIPVLGHAERFLRHPHLAGCAELRDGTRGRFNRNRLSAFCPSLNSTKQFLSAYLAEIAALFPSQYFHIGLDEVWDLGFCPLCQDKPEEDLFLGHLLWVHELLAGSGKRCIMWADMLELYPGLVDRMPRDILLADWHYDRDIHAYHGHFCNQCQDDLVTRCQQAGFEVLAAVSDFSRSNITTGYQYARQRGIKKMLITTWARPQAFFLRQQIMFQFAGKILQGTPDAQACDATCRQIFGNAPKEFGEGLRLAMQIPENRFGENFNLADNWLFCRPFSGLPYAQWESYALALQLLEDHPPACGQSIYQDILLGLRGRVVSHRIKALCHCILKYGLTDCLQKELTCEISRASELMETVQQLWAEHRGRFSMAPVVEYHHALKKNLSELLPKLKAKRYLLVRFFQPDSYGSVRTSVEWEGREQHAEIFKLLDSQDSFFEIFLPINGKIPEEIRIASSGYGGQGIAYIEILEQGRHIAPQGVNVLSGKVSNPEHILCNDTRWSYFGSQSVREAFQNLKIADAQHRISVTF